MMGLTPRRQECLDFIRAHIREKGIPPSYREIQDALGLRSKAGVNQLLKGLVARGRITLNPTRKRSIKVVEPEDNHGADCLCAACPARRLQYQQIIQGLQTEAKFAPGIILTGLRPLSDRDRLHWKRGFPKHNTASRTRAVLPSGVR